MSHDSRFAAEANDSHQSDPYVDESSISSNLATAPSQRLDTAEQHEHLTTPEGSVSPIAEPNSQSRPTQDIMTPVHAPDGSRSPIDTGQRAHRGSNPSIGGMWSRIPSLVAMWSGSNGSASTAHKAGVSEDSSSVNRSLSSDVSFSDNDLQCPICHDTMTEVFMTYCGHSYCYKCVSQHIQRSANCPLCRSPLSGSQLFPNFHLNNLAEHRRAMVTARLDGSSRYSESVLSQKSGSSEVESIVDRISKSLPYDELVRVLSDALEKKRRTLPDDQEMKDHLLQHFLYKIKDRNERAIADLKHQLGCIEEDLTRTSEASGRSNWTSPQQLQPQIAPECQKENDENYDVQQRRGQKRSHDEMAGFISYASIDTSAVPEGKEYEAAMKRLRVEERLDDLQEIYLTTSRAQGSERGEALETFSTTLYQVTKYSQFRVLDTMFYTDVGAASSIVSSIEFDRDGGLFAVGGVTKEIKIYDFSMIGHCASLNTSQEDDESNSANENVPATFNRGPGERQSSFVGRRRTAALVHCPVQVMQCGNKISCLSWNPYIKPQLASSDYEGIITIWDASTGQSVQTFEEHKRRVWSIDTCTTNPTLLASGSDDSTVKIWSIQAGQSVHTLEQKGNVCCTKFAPNNSHQIAIGSADHHVSCYDLRYAVQPFQTFNGHEKAVSYVKWISDDEIVSASTDSTLKLWDVDYGECKRTFSGHQNEKNFVGLSLNGDWISCGSETNTLYTYHKSSSMPVVSYKFPVIDTLTGQELAENDPPLFVSSVCWKSDSNRILAANSKGMIKVLSMEE